MPHLDHNHENGQIRGVLCHGCNLGLGGFKDNPNLLLKAIRYVRYWNKKPVNPHSNASNKEFKIGFKAGMADKDQEILMSGAILPSNEDLEKLIKIFD